VVGDVVDLARDLMQGASGRIPVLSYQTENIRKLPVMPMADIVTHYYFRFNALDRPGVLSKISGILGEHEISLKSVHQKGRKTNGSVSLVMLTHRAREAAVVDALKKIAALDIVAGTPMLVRIEDEMGEEN
jgi:homoserine dehydrogenase